MFKIKTGVENAVVTTMGMMAPCDIGITDDGTIVMRTAAVDKFEVMDLSDPGPNRCWCDIMMVTPVRLFPRGSEITLVVK